MVQFKSFSIQDAESIMNEWIESNGTILPIVSRDFEQIRKELEELYPDIDGKRKDYFTDVEMGINLYEFLNRKEWFSMRLAANDSFWRILSVQIAPHLVAKRWDYTAIDHYYKKSRRIWFKAIWWYVYLSLVRNRMDKTRDILKSQNFTTDTIEALVERPGVSGYNVKLCRKIVEYYSKVSYSGSVSTLFRSVMKLNTARAMVMEPELCEGGVEGYAKSLFTDLNATFI